MANIHFFLLKINGIDIGQLPTHQQMTALSTLYNEETEHIVLELKRKSCWNMHTNAEGYNDIQIAKDLCFLTIHHNTPILENTANENSTMARIGSGVIVNLHLPASNLEQYYMAKSTQTEDITFYVHEHLNNLQKDTERLVEHEHNLFEQSLAPEIDIEEITLRKSDSNERLGITVCYSNSEDYMDGGGSNVCGDVSGETAVAEVYISDIHPDSVAGRDGRLRQGDQILQINGKDIKTRPETETLIAENNNAVTLLVSRYLYADEDDFNDPSTNEDEDELLVVDDDDDDEDDEEFYEENVPYVNYLMNNDCCINVTGELDKALISQVESQEHLQQSREKPKEKCTFNALTSLIRSNPAYQSNSPKSTSDNQKEKFLKSEKKSFVAKCVKNTKSNLSKIDTCSSAKAHNEYDTEHIYETIPEDSESEPFYCSPYDSSVYVTAMTTCSSAVTDTIQNLQQKERVAQWLGIKQPQEISSTATRQSARINYERTAALLNKNSTDTARSTLTSITNGTVDCMATNFSLPSNCLLEDQDNSSSAYNTGGSNNSVSPLTLMLNPKNRLDQNPTLPITTINSPINGISDDNIGIQQLLTKASVQLKTHSSKDKSKITSPKSGTFQQKMTTCAHKAAVKDIQSQSIIVDKSATTFKDQRNVLQKRNYVNQTMSLQKSLHNPPLQQKIQYYIQQPDQMQCPQFTAPNLSQYHFVSSQEVNNLSLNNKMPKSSCTFATPVMNNTRKDEDTMVWKVKRRPDGSRYIVRRPAKNRLFKERNTRLNVERLRNDITTTEDDTISEIKTGRYWTREERKKHIEKARERRQQQQQLSQLQLNKTHSPYDDSSNATLCISDAANRILIETSDRVKVKNQQISNFKCQEQVKLPHQQQHYQLQFSSNDEHKHSSLLCSIESPTKKSSSALPTTLEELHSGKANVDKSNTIEFTASEHNQITNSLKSVIT